MVNTRGHRRGWLAFVVAALLATVVVPSTPTSAAQPRESSFDCDFNGDGDADYAIGVPNEDLPRRRDAGAVEVLYGNWDAGGAKATATLTLGRDGVAGDRMGTTILCQQFGFTGDGAGALVVGIPYRTVNGRAAAGEVRVYYGFSDADPDTLGFCAPADIETAGCTNRTSRRVFQVFRQGVGGVPGSARANDRFGWDFAWGNFNLDGYIDLAIGIPGEDIGRVQDAGAVQILFGSPEGLVVPPGGGLIREGSGAAGSPGRDAAFGFSLAAGDIFGDAATDLVVGAPNSRVRGQISAGTVHVVTMREGGGIVGGREFSQAMTGDPVEAGDFFGGTVSVGQFDGSGKEDVAVGVPLEDQRRRTDVGQVHVLRSGSWLRPQQTLKPPRRFGANASSARRCGSSTTRRPASTVWSSGAREQPWPDALMPVPFGCTQAARVRDSAEAPSSRSPASAPGSHRMPATVSAARSRAIGDWIFPDPSSPPTTSSWGHPSAT